MDTLQEAGRQAFFMFWDTLWALVVGFVLSGLVQAYVSRTKMQAVLGDHGPRALGRATFFGVVSSSCSYAASALAKTLFSRGADFTAAIVFMLASTNLVVELGLVMWLLLGWQFAAAEILGGIVMILLLGLVLPRVIPARLTDPARTRLAGPHAGHGGHEHHGAPTEQKGTLKDAAAYTMADLTMIRKELVIGFVVAGVLAAYIPTKVWQALFITGHGAWTAIENVVVGPFLAIISFVCSVGNVPLAAALWTGGIGFGGVIAFIYADLIAFPLLVIYRKYFGTAIALRLLAVMWFAMAVAGLVVEVVFSSLDLVPHRHMGMARMGFAWDHTTFLNIAAVIVMAVVIVLARRRGTSEAYAIDPICGMQVEKAHAAAVRQGPEGTVYFCADRCAERWEKGQGAAPMTSGPAVMQIGPPPTQMLQIGLRPPMEPGRHGDHGPSSSEEKGDCCGGH